MQYRTGYLYFCKTEKSRVKGERRMNRRDRVKRYLAMLLAFAMSMDDVIISVFVTGVDTNTLPVKIYSQLKTGVTPEINALCTLLFLATLLLCGLAALVGRTPKKQDSGKDVTER